MDATVVKTRAATNVEVSAQNLKNTEELLVIAKLTKTKVDSERQLDKDISSIKLKEAKMLYLSTSESVEDVTCNALEAIRTRVISETKYTRLTASHHSTATESAYYCETM